MPKEPMVVVSMRIPRAMRDELDRLAADVARATGAPRPDRSVVGRQMWADGIRRARIAGRYAARFAASEPAAKDAGT